MINNVRNDGVLESSFLFKKTKSQVIHSSNLQQLEQECCLLSTYMTLNYPKGTSQSLNSSAPFDDRSLNISVSICALALYDFVFGFYFLEVTPQGYLELCNLRGPLTARTPPVPLNRGEGGMELDSREVDIGKIIGNSIWSFTFKKGLKILGEFV